jgi:hypothetical protein
MLASDSGAQRTPDDQDRLSLVPPKVVINYSLTFVKIIGARQEFSGSGRRFGDVFCHSAEEMIG